MSEVLSSATLFWMERILAIDFGEKRIGLATSDASGLIATPRRTVHRRTDETAILEILRFCEEEEIGMIVLGIPRSPAGEESPFAARVRSFARKLAARTALRIRFHEETLTSDEAARRRSGSFPMDLDPAAAAVLLEDFLHQESGS
jgi:putative Holliday junction resolvase